MRRCGADMDTASDDGDDDDQQVVSGTAAAPVVHAPLVHSWRIVRGTLQRRAEWLRRGIRPIVTVYVNDVPCPRQAVPHNEFEEDGETWVALDLERPLSEGDCVTAEAAYVDEAGHVVARSARSAGALVNDFPIDLLPSDGKPLALDEEYIIERITNFFSRNLVRDRIIPTINGSANFALRDVVWAVTNYFPHKHVRIAVPEENRPILLGDEYVIWRKRYHKSNFDQYARERHYRVTCSHDTRLSIELSLGQLIFLEWSLRYLVLDYVAEHIEAIKEHREECLQQRRDEKRACVSAGVAYKRHPLVECADEPIAVFSGDARVYF